MSRLIPTFLLVASLAGPVLGQQKAPDGRVFGELLPFVDLARIIHESV